MTERATFTTSDGERIAYYIDDFTDPWRQPPVMLLLHSAMGNSQRFYSWVPGLARHFRLVRMDLRGHGASSVPPADKQFDMDRLVADVTELMTLLGLEAAHVTGNSAGGYVAQNLALKHPTKVQSLALVGSTPGLSPSARGWLTRIAKEGLTPFLTDTIAMRFDLATSDPGLVDWFLKQTAENDPAFLARFIGYNTTQDWSGELHRIACPTLVIFPGGETVGEANVYDLMRERIPDVRMAEYEHMPHNIADMMPDRCVSDILAFHRDRFGYPAR
ncbi:alpha/beta hydrolase [Roseomonas stagni]|uniref:Alpha/beta hydrolase n=1 Tax=Falsiroseomonas algicola TaxID=2716930 RepID=A0A6M1LPY1_9PROT|nr:alpha/beta hydrolase [Falsiroseomonas algicola]NGM22440.1 alpha/beta hydrolase [Falsiroseomonas algicola]